MRRCDFISALCSFVELQFTSFFLVLCSFLDLCFRMVSLQQYQDLERKYRESVDRVASLQAYISRLPLRSELDQLEAQLSECKSKMAAMEEAMRGFRRREKSLLEEVESLQRKLESKPPDSDKNLAAFLASEKVSAILKNYEDQIVKNKESAREWEAKSTALLKENSLLQKRLTNVEADLQSTQAKLKAAEQKLKYHEELEADVMKESASLWRRFSAYCEDASSVVKACKEAVECREVTPVLLLDAIVGRADGPENRFKQIEDFPSYLQYIRKACDEVVDLRDGLHASVRFLVDACTKFLCDSDELDVCLVQ